jgi:hypothetical protein
VRTPKEIKTDVLKNIETQDADIADSYITKIENLIINTYRRNYFKNEGLTSVTHIDSVSDFDVTAVFLELEQERYEVYRNVMKSLGAQGYTVTANFTRSINLSSGKQYKGEETPGVGPVDVKYVLTYTAPTGSVPLARVQPV